MKDVHGWFELSYAHYLTIPRSVLQAMPDEWQERFVQCLEELDEAIDWRPPWPRRYWVSFKNQSTGRFESIASDPFNNYRHPNRIEVKATA